MRFTPIFKKEKYMSSIRSMFALAVSVTIALCFFVVELWQGNSGMLLIAGLIFSVVSLTSIFFMIDEDRE